MKKLLSLIVILACVSLGRAYELKPTFRVWKASFSNTQDGITMLSSGNIIIHAILIASPTVNAPGSGSNLTIFSSNEDFPNLTVPLATRAFAQTNTSALDTAQDKVFDVQVASHAYYSKLGAASTIILWDWTAGHPVSVTTVTGSPTLIPFKTPHDTE